MLLVIFFIMSVETFAYKPEEGNITASIGPYIFKTNYKETNPATHSPFMPGMGLIVNGDINQDGALEIAFFHLNKRFLRRDAQNFIAELTQVIHITMGYKWWVNPYFSTSMALYSAYPIGNKRVVYNNFPTGTELQTSATDTTEYGFDFAAQSQVWSGSTFDIVAELRYSLSLTSRQREEADHYGGFVGLRYLLQEKNSENAPHK